MWHEAWYSAYDSWEMIVHGSSWHEFLLVALYIIAAALCFAACQASRHNGGSGGAWLPAACLLVLLGINALYRIDIFLTNFIRFIARAGGWYGDRRDWQFILLLLIGAEWFLRRKGGMA